MKIFRKVVPVIFIICLVLFGVNVSAENNIGFDDFGCIQTSARGILHTIITDTDGNTHYLDGTFTTEDLDNSGMTSYVAAYSVYKGEKELYTTELRNVDYSVVTDDTGLLDRYGSSAKFNGLHTLEFMLTDDEQCFLTGLSAEKVSEIQNKITESAIAGNDFSITDTTFIDAEKIKNDNGADDDMCWAAAISNVLHYTGWADKASYPSSTGSMTDEDDIFELFISNFDDGSGNGAYALPWFFNGNYYAQNTDRWAHVKDYANSGGYLKDYDVKQIMSHIRLNDGDGYRSMGYVLEQIKKGYGAQLGIMWGNTGYGHAVTTWGYVVDTSRNAEEKEYYKALIIADSDSDKNTSDRRTAPNKLRLVNLSPYKGGKYDSWKTDNYRGGISSASFDTGIINEFVILPQYSDSIAKETSATATRNRRTTVDLVPKIDVGILDNNELKSGRAFYVNQPIAIEYGFGNESDVPIVDEVVVEFKCELKKDNTVLGTDIIRSKLANLRAYFYGTFGEFTKIGSVNLSGLEAGKYTATFTVDINNSVAEAYEYQNTASIEFTVSERDEIVGLYLDGRESKLRIYSTATRSAKLVIAGYNANDCIEEVQYESVSLTKGNNGIGLKSELIGCEYIKVLLCTDDGKLIPICESKKISFYE